jgi:hypothetical protein
MSWSVPIMTQLAQDYVFLPQRLLADLRANPAAIGVYALIGRLFLIYQAPIPLSAADLQRYDPTLSYGAARGALQRLIALRWLSDQSGHKNCYTPTWGAIKGTPRLWQMDAPTLGRPTHVTTLRLDRRLLDVCLGKLVPHPIYPAQTNDRYLEQPILSLRDVGAYAQILGGQGMAATPALWRYGLIRDGMAQPLSSATDLIALASQRTLDGDGAAPTEHGLRKLGLELSSAPPETPPGQPLFFVDHDLIPDPISHVIPELIPLGAKANTPSSAAERTKFGEESDLPTRAGTPGILSETSDSPSNLPTHGQRGGGGDHRANKDISPRTTRPETASARLLQSIHAFPSTIKELADMPAELVGRAIAYAESEPGIESIPGWVIEALRRQRDEGWPIPQVRTRHGSGCIDVQEIMGGKYGDLFRLGSDLTDLDCSLTGPELGGAGAQTTAQDLTLNRTLPGAGAAVLGAGQSPSDSAAIGSDQAAEPAAADAQIEEMTVDTADHTTLVQLWNRVLNLMQTQTSRHEFNTWIRRTALLAITNGVVTLGAPSAFFKEGFEHRYSGTIRHMISDLYVPVNQVRVVITGESGCGGSEALSPQPYHVST